MNSPPDTLNGEGHNSRIAAFLRKLLWSIPLIDSKGPVTVWLKYDTVRSGMPSATQNRNSRMNLFSLLLLQVSLSQSLRKWKVNI